MEAHRSPRQAEVKGYRLWAVRVIPAVTSDVPLETTGIGNVEALASVDVKSRVTAPVIRVHFAEGEDVKQGQILFDLDPETWNRQIAELEANVAEEISEAERQAASQYCEGSGIFEMPNP